MRRETTRERGLPKQRERASAFTLAELLVTTGVLVLLVFLAAQLLTTAATVTILGHKKMDADSQARQLFDRMAVDFAQMIKRPDVDYYVKSNPVAAVGQRTVLQPGNDQIAFYSGVPGYIPASNYKSPLSLVAYRVNSGSNKIERMGKTLIWNAAPTPIPTPPVTPTPTGTPAVYTPAVFIPVPLASPLPASDMPTVATPTPTPPSPAWPEAAIGTPTPYPWSDSEVIGPQVFRFEYYYLLKAKPPLPAVFSDTPFDTRAGVGNTKVNGMQDVSAIVVDIAVIDPKSKVLLTSAQIAKFSTPSDSQHFLGDFTLGMTPGQLRTQWQNTLNGIINPNSPNFDSTMPRPAISGIRVYERFFYLSPPI